MKRYTNSHLIEATYFIKDEKTKFVMSYSTNSHGKRITTVTIQDEFGTKIHFSSYQEIKDMIVLMQKALKLTKGKWIYQKKVT